jgi:hypothetical protein
VKTEARRVKSSRQGERTSTRGQRAHKTEDNTPDS